MLGTASIQDAATIRASRPRPSPHGAGPDQTVEGDRELAYADPGRVPYRVGDGAGGSRDPDLADALDAERIDVWVVLLDENRYQRGDVGVDRHMVFPEIRVHDASGARVHDRTLMQSEGYAPDHAAVILAAHQARIDDAAGGEGADETRRADLPEFGIDLHFRENGAVRVHGMTVPCRRVGRAFAASLDFGETGARQDFGVALASALVVAPEQPAAAGDDPRVAGAEQRRAF